MDEDSLLLFNLFILVTALTGNAFSTTVQPYTTIPTTHPSGCVNNGVHYENGDEITSETDNIYMCYGAYCEDGAIIYWDHKCFLYPDHCPGSSTKVLGQCCPECHNTTTSPPTTTPPHTTTMHDGCVIDGIVYANGDEITSETDNIYMCYGAYCEDGAIIYWDHKCFLYPDHCPGSSTKVLGQCCPECHNTTTSPPTTTPPHTTPMHGGCVIDGIVYANGEEIVSDTTNCSRVVCSNGDVMPSDVQCAYNTSCNGVFSSIPGQCCNVCIEVTSPVSNTSTPRKTCKDVTCTEVLDCEKKDTYRPYGSCCYTCGSMQTVPSLLLHFFLAVLVICGTGVTLN